MKIVIKTTNLRLNQELRNYIKEKIGSLEKFAKLFQNKNYFNHFFKKGKPRVEVWLEIGKTTRHHQKGDIFRAEAQMRLPGKSLRAESKREDLKLAITEIKDELQRELKKYKGKAEAITKRKTRVFKKSLSLSPLARFAREARRARFKKRKGGRTREEGV